MATSTLCWSAITIGTAFVKNFDQLAAVRVLLGAAEAAIIPCTSMYLTMAYNRSEYAVKKSYVQIAAAFSGAFGGLLAYGLTQINAAGLAGWQWMYLVEGIISMLLVPIVFLLLPNSPSEARWLKPEEKELMARRLWSNRGVYDEKEEFQWSEITRCLTDWKVYVQAVV
jgi:MFS family permease